MIPYLQAENLSLRYGNLLLFSNISFTISKEQKVALIARNGAGKSSLLDLLSGKETPDSGLITWTKGITVGYLEQMPSLNPAHTVLEEIFSADDPRLQLVKAYELALTHHDQEAISSLSLKMDELNAWDMEVEIRQILTQLRIPDLEAHVGSLSGGQQKRLGLAKVLIGKPDFLLLDEPTNHLDLNMIEWLENELSKSKTTLLMVTHDRYFLDRICDEIIEMDGDEIFSYKGNYSYFLVKREERLQSAAAAAAKAQNLLRTEIEWMRRMPQARTHKARYRIDAFSGLQERARDRQDDRVIDLNFRASRLGKKILVIEKLTKSFGDLRLLDGFTYTFSRGEKAGIIGDNGTGKTTFLNLITGSLQPDSGKIDIGQTISFAYYRQEGIAFNPQDKVLDAVQKIAEVIRFENGGEITASQMLTRFLFPPSVQFDYIEKLSGGEKRRLYLCTILMQNPNFLILDEPTNDLDILTLNVLEEYLRTFDGCVLIVSHDRYFMDKIADHLFVFQGGGIIKDFPGNYTQYRNWLEENEKSVKPEKKNEPPKVREKALQEGKSKLTFKEKRELEQLETEIADLELKKKQLEEQLNSGNLLHEALFTHSHEIGKINNLLEEKEFRWLELSERDN
ncbi:MAG TPA: ABC-F family ATP-binding cassette domain-containing protein [Prolixibacteraceae bacterium]|nr:ABC-F family ATP-binding cassette domain-containing protein [Prolixibacteraceae bacterium]